MNDTEAGYTLMETLISIAIVLTLSCVLVIAAAASMKTLSRSFSAINTALTIARIDRFIRSSVGSLHVPYWANSQTFIVPLSDELYRSRFSAFIVAVNPIRDSRHMYRGLEVTYTVNNRETKTRALFSSIPVVEPSR